MLNGSTSSVNSTPAGARITGTTARNTSCSVAALALVFDLRGRVARLEAAVTAGQQMDAVRVGVHVQQD